MADPHAVLGVHPGASKAEIKVRVLFLPGRGDCRLRWMRDACSPARAACLVHPHGLPAPLCRAGRVPPEGNGPPPRHVREGVDGAEAAGQAAVRSCCGCLRRCGLRGAPRTPVPLTLEPRLPPLRRHTTASEQVRAANDAAFKALNEAYQALTEGGARDRRGGLLLRTRQAAGHRPHLPAARPLLCRMKHAAHA